MSSDLRHLQGRHPNSRAAGLVDAVDWDAVVSRCWRRGLLWVGPLDRAEGGAVSGGGGGALDSTVRNDAVATQGHDHPACSVLASASRPLTGAASSAHTSRTALLTKGAPSEAPTTWLPSVHDAR